MALWPKKAMQHFTNMKIWFWQSIEQKRQIKGKHKEVYVLSTAHAPAMGQTNKRDNVILFSFGINLNITY